MSLNWIPSGGSWAWIESRGINGTIYFCESFLTEGYTPDDMTACGHEQAFATLPLTDTTWRQCRDLTGNDFHAGKLL